MKAPIGTPQRPAVIGTRASALATTQTGLVARALKEAGLAVAIAHVTTEGDTNRASLASLGGTGVFAARLRQAVLEGDCDIAVHSAKDLPAADAPGLAVAAYPPRENTADVLVAADGMRLADLPAGARIGTGSPRRAAQLLAARPDLEVADIRGNVPTRIGRVRGLARAGGASAGGHRGPAGALSGDAACGASGSIGAVRVATARVGSASEPASDRTTHVASHGIETAGVAKTPVAPAPARSNPPGSPPMDGPGDLDGVVLAYAGLARLGLLSYATDSLDGILLPAGAQGALAVEMRAEDLARGDRKLLADAVASLDHLPTRLEVEAERALLRTLGAGCAAPLAVAARYVAPAGSGGARLEMTARVVSHDGRNVCERKASVSIGNDVAAARALGETLARDMLASGAADVADLHAARSPGGAKHELWGE